MIDPRLRAVEAGENQGVKQDAGVPKRDMTPDDGVLQRRHSHRQNAARFEVAIDLLQKQIDVHLVLQNVRQPEAVERLYELVVQIVGDDRSGVGGNKVDAGNFFSG